MIRIREIRDPDLREAIRRALAAQRGMPAATVPDWFELDDADFADLLQALREPQEQPDPWADDPRL